MHQSLGGKVPAHVLDPGTGGQARGNGASLTEAAGDEGVEERDQLGDGKPVDPVVIPKEQELSSPICQDVEAQKMA